MATRYLDPAGSAGSADGSSFSNRAQYASQISGLAAGDTVRVKKSPDATSSGINATFTNKSLTVTLASSLTQLLYGDGNWTAVGASGCATDTTKYKEGSNGVKITVGSSTTGSLAYVATGSALNLSAYQLVSFWLTVDQNIASGKLRIDLCSDTAGATVVNSLTFNQAINSGDQMPVVIDNGSALGSSIQSIRIYALTSLGATTNIYIDNVIASKALTASDCLTLASLISADNVIWWPVKSINGTTVVIDAFNNSIKGVGRGFSGTTGTVALYLRQLVFFNARSLSGNDFYLHPTAGSSGSRITVSGGWDTTAMTSQTGETWIDLAFGISGLGGNGFTDFSKISVVRSSNGLFPNGTNETFTNCHVISASSCPYTMTSNLSVIDTCNSISSNDCNFLGVGSDQITLKNSQLLSPQCSTAAIMISSAAGSISLFDNVTIANAASRGLYFQNPIPRIRSTTIKDCASDGIYNYTGQFFRAYGLTITGNSGWAINSDFTQTFEIYGLTTSSNSSGCIRAGSGQTDALLYDASISESTILSFGGIVCQKLNSQREGGNPNVNVLRTEIGKVQTQATTVQTGASIAWQFSPTSAQAANADYPLSQSLGAFPCKSGKTITITYWCQVDNTNLGGQLRISGGRHPGVGSYGSDITTSINPSANTWTQYSISATPSEDTVIEVFGDFWTKNGTTTYNGYVSGPISVSST